MDPSSLGVGLSVATSLAAGAAVPACLRPAAGEAHAWLYWAQLHAQLLQASSQSSQTAELGLLRDQDRQGREQWVRVLATGGNQEV